jgi:hypothetical protein
MAVTGSVRLQTNLDQIWNLAKDICRRSQLYIFSVSPFFTLHENVRFGLRVQPVNATHALNLSAGVSNSNV